MNYRIYFFLQNCIKQSKRKKPPWDCTSMVIIGHHIPYVIQGLYRALCDAVYMGCPRRNVQDFGRVFLMLNCTDITQNTYVQSRTVTEIMAREKCGRHWCRHTIRRP